MPNDACRDSYDLFPTGGGGGDSSGGVEPPAEMEETSVAVEAFALPDPPEVMELVP